MATIVEFDRLHELDDGIWCCRSHFSLGENQNEGLQWQGLKDRLLSLLPKGLESSELQDASESNQAELKEEAAKLTSLLADKYEPFPLDTTMIIARTGNGKDVAIFSPVPYTEELNRTVSDLGPVKALVCPNLQHWLFIPQWAQAHPDATIYLAPPALGEDLAVKLSKHASACVPQPQDEWVVLQEDGHQLGPDIDQQLLLGAPLNMNEVLFYHRPSRTLIAADGFYSGYRLEEQPTWFARLWFKVRPYFCNTHIIRTVVLGRILTLIRLAGYKGELPSCQAACLPHLSRVNARRRGSLATVCGHVGPAMAV
eukprot:TRINITY_DN11555_c5_g1_i5.p1 TRINITY_DN11555_c5_g1~~TRINITY_DN11555_c5_g1_i5.p1  ORF type:complete len:312 (+),score=24.57 TRINITY_DN11555_c5_g1_i5:1-936(+)